MTENKAIADLLEIYPYEKLETLIIHILPKLNVMPYVSKDAKAFKPTELKRNFDKIINKIKELEIKGSQNKVNITI